MKGECEHKSWCMCYSCGSVVCSLCGLVVSKALGVLTLLPIVYVCDDCLSKGAKNG